MTRLSILPPISIIACLPCVLSFTCTPDIKKTCAACPVGHFSNASSAQCEMCCERPGACASVNGTSFCQPCPPGAFNNVTGSSKCQLCPAGTSTDKQGSQTCMPCSPGAHTNVTGSSACTMCAPGHYCPDSGCKECSPCSPGSYSNIYGSSNCSLCETGHHQSAAGQTSCQKCGLGVICNHTGCVNCSNCPAGWESLQDAGVNCTMCQRGTYKNTDHGLCPPCAHGYYTDKPGQIECEQCPIRNYCPCLSCGPNPCPQDAVCPAGTMSPQPCQPPWYIINKTEQTCSLSSVFKAVVGGVCSALVVCLVVGAMCFISEARRWRHASETTPLVTRPEDHQEPVYSGL